MDYHGIRLGSRPNPAIRQVPDPHSDSDYIVGTKCNSVQKRNKGSLMLSANSFLFQSQANTMSYLTGGQGGGHNLCAKPSTGEFLFRTTSVSNMI